MDSIKYQEKDNEMKNIKDALIDAKRISQEMHDHSKKDCVANIQHKCRQVTLSGMLCTIDIIEQIQRKYKTKEK